VSERQPKDTPFELVLLDFSSLPRFGLKGASLQSWLEQHGYIVGDASNRAYHQHDGSLAARLSPRELLFLCDPARPDLSTDHDYLSPRFECYTVRRLDSHYWYALNGRSGDCLLAHLCGVDFNPDTFDNGQLAQTRVAGTGAIVIRNDDGDSLRYHLLGDRSYAVYMWKCLQDILRDSIWNEPEIVADNC